LENRRKETPKEKKGSVLVFSKHRRFLRKGLRESKKDAKAS